MREVIDAVERVTGRPVPHTLGAAAAGRSGGAVRLGAIASGATSAGRRAFADLRTIVDTAWQWRRRHPHGYAGGRDRQVERVNEFRRLLGYTRPYRGRLAAALAAMIVYGAGSAGLAALIKPIFDKVLPTRSGVARGRHRRSSASTCSRASARTCRPT